MDPGTRVTHQVRLVDEGSPTRRGGGASPRVSRAREVWVKLVAPHTRTSPRPGIPPRWSS